MKAQHGNLFHTMSEASFKTAVKSLRESIPLMNDYQILAGFVRLVGMVQDGHNNLDLSFGTGLQYNYPLRFWVDGDTAYVVRAPRKAAALVEGRLLSIDGVPADSLWKAMLPLSPHDPGNPGFGARALVRRYLLSAHLLYGLGFTKSLDSARFAVERKGKRLELTLHAEPISVRSLYYYTAPPDWADARNTSHDPPLWVRHPDSTYWFEYLPAQKFLYVQMNEVGNAPGSTTAEFARRILDFADHNPVDRLALDLRRNGGGNNFLLRPLIVTLIQLRKIDQRGKLFVLISPETFSAAQNLTNRLENYTEATFVGEPTGENVNFYGDTRRFRLPNSHIPVAMANLYWQDKDPRDRRTATFPEIAVSPSFEDYVLDRDPAMDLILGHTSGFPTIEESVLAGLRKGGFDGAFDAYRAFVSDPVHRYFTNAEGLINNFGYSLIAEGRLEDAIIVFRVNTKAFPLSFNTWDSLGEGYADAGKNDEAISAYKESLRLNPTSPTGLAALAKLQRR
jgi:tetratricopeptide (TPR) repeat protein